MKHTQYKIKSRVWLYTGMAAWHFVTIPVEISEDIKKGFGDRTREWGSLPVEVTLGNANWNTAIFPDKRLGAYLLPLKAEIRKKEKISANDMINFLIDIKV